MKNHPLDPDGKLSDKQYSEAIDAIQNERYRSWIFWKKVSRFLYRLAPILILAAILYFMFWR